MKHYLESMTPTQREATLHMDGPAMVLASPGSGKTRIVTYRIVNLIEEGVNPAAIAAITFTNKAANEMRDRVGQVLPQRHATAVLISTFHSFCARLLRIEYEAAGLHQKFTICDGSDTTNHITQAICLELGVSPKKVRGFRDHRSTRYVGRYISDKKQNLLTPTDVLDAAMAQGKEGSIEKFLRKCYERYQMALLRNRSVDFDDLIMLSVLMLRKHPEVQEKYARRIQYMMVDEYQDTNLSQYELVRRLNSFRSNITVVGDVDQCLPGSELVYTEDGPKQIRHAKEGMRVRCGGGRGTSSWGAVDKVFKRPYDGAVLKLTLSNGESLRATPEHCIFGRVTSDTDYHYVYLMYAKRLGFRVGQCDAYRSKGYKTKDGSKDVVGFIQRLRQERADAIWVLKTCNTKEEATYWENYYAAQYGLPTVCLFSAGRKISMSDEQISELFAAINTLKRGRRLLLDVGLSEDHPHHYAQGRDDKTGYPRRKIVATAFGQQRKVSTQQGTWHEHICSMHSSDKKLKRQVEKQGFNTSTYGTKGERNKYWRTRMAHVNQDVMFDSAESLAEATNALVVKQARLGKDHTYNFMPIGNAVPGMRVPTINYRGEVEELEVVSVEQQHYKGFVYDLSVPGFRNYCAGQGAQIIHNSIYRFRGADIRNVTRLEEDYPDVKIFFMEENFRSTPQIAQVANELIAYNKDRKEKLIKAVQEDGKEVRCLQCADNGQEAGFIVDEIEARVKKGELRYKDCAIIYRTHAKSRKFSDVLKDKRIPHKIIGGVNFYERQAVKDILSFMRLRLNPFDEASFTRVYDTPPRGFGERSYEKMIGMVLEEKCSVVKVFKDQRYEKVLKGPPLTGARKLRNIFKQLYQHGTGKVVPVMKAAIEASGYRTYLEGDTGNQKKNYMAEENLGLIDELVQSAKEFDENHGGGLLYYFEFVSLMQMADEDEEGDHVTLMSCHAAKGLEFPVVYVVGAIQGSMPIIRPTDDAGNPKSSEELQKDIEEERRVMFVAATRAERELTVSTYTRRPMYGSWEDCEHSQFIKEMGDTVKHEDIAGSAMGSYSAARPKQVRRGRYRNRSTSRRVKMF